jgi:hypothetical protein
VEMPRDGNDLASLLTRLTEAVAWALDTGPREIAVWRTGPIVAPAAPPSEATP